MPTQIIQIQNNECIEPITSNIYRSVSAGTFAVVNKYLSVILLNTE